MKINEITVKGVKQATSAVIVSPDDLTRPRLSFVMSGLVRGLTETHTETLAEDDLIELVFEDQTQWFCSPDTLADVFPEAAVQNRSVSGTFEVPATLRNTGPERGIIGDIALKALHIFTRNTLGKRVKELAADLERKQLENHSGLYRLDAAFQFQPFKPELSPKPLLLFLHGTASSTRGSFGELAQSGLWTYIQQTYGEQVLAFEHETLTKSPLENVLDLVNQLPANATLHLISHSRGGLVGDILSRLGSSDENNRGFDENEINYLAKENRTEDQEMIKRLNEAMKNRKITVEKFIRVACPAGGTILASKRLDHFFNISFNLIGFGTGVAVNPVYTAFKNLIASVIETKNDVEVLPGLEAMNPDSPFIKVLNSPATRVKLDSPLTVISGNCKIKLDLKALVIIASKLFYLKDNDLVVNTRSMYQGTPRLTPLQYFFDHATDTDHFHYFKNTGTNHAILRALQAVGDGQIEGFTRIQQRTLLETERNAILNLDGGQVFTNTVTGTKPIVVLLPGIMGSNLSQDDNLLWINYFRFIRGNLTRLNIDSPGIKAPSLIRTSYKRLVDYLSSAYDVVTFPFDWRLQLNESAALFDKKINELLAYKQPIKIIGHSMGGVLVRDFILTHPDTWAKLNRSAGFRLVFLGSPLGGSFRIPSVLFGQDAIIDKLSKIDIFHTKEELLQTFSQLPGLLSLLPFSTDQENDFANAATWKTMRQAFGKANWPLPKDTDLQTFKNYRDAINQQADQIDYRNMVYIAGKDASTPCGYRIDDTAQGKQLVFLSTSEGDQSVTWETGIPQPMITNQSVYYANVTHGSLANEPSLFQGIAELLEKGFTTLLSKNRPVVRGEEKLFITPQQDDFDLSPAGIERTLLGLGEEGTAIISEVPLEAWVSNGDLRHAMYPVMAGHFLGDGILYAEKAIDHYLQGALTERHRLGVYPGEIGTSEILISTAGDFPGTITVGLGPLGSLTAFQLTQTVEQGVAKYLLNLNSQVFNQPLLTHNPAPLGISTLIIGCGYGGLTVDSSVRAILQGVQNANDKVKRLQHGKARLIQCIEFVEKYEDNALSCFYSLSKIEKDESKSLNIEVSRRKIKTLLGSQKRLLAEASGDWWNRITVLRKEPDPASKTPCLLFSASTGGAREEQRKLYTSPVVLEQLIANISRNNRWSPALAKTVYELMIPNDFKDQLKKNGHINWILDKYTAAYPWELLQDSIGDAKPLCVNAGMVRQLATQDYRLKIKPVAQRTALVIGEPNLKGFLAPLPGALQEGQMVAKILSEQGYTTTSSLNEDAPTIIQALFQEDYKIIHLAGHGLFDAENPENAGMVLGKDVYLSTREISQMSTVPEFVFVNCCYLGRTDGAAEDYYRNLYKMAANIGTQLIENGVKAVVVAGWAVHDAAALDFTEKLYHSLFKGEKFGDAITEARKLVYSKYKNINNTWGAYQCYGDPFYKLKNNPEASWSNKYEFVIAEQAEIELENLHNTLDSNNHFSTAGYLDQLRAISQAVDKAGLNSAAITQKEAFIYAELYEYEAALGKFESLLRMEKASFTIDTLERYCNIKAKKLVMDFLQSNKTLKGVTAKINKIIEDLKNLLNLSPTSERFSLLGNTYKRKAIVSNDKGLKQKAYAEAAFYYRKAYLKQSSLYSAYALTNWLEIESMLVAAGDRQWGGNVTLGNESYVLPSPEEATSLLNQVKSSLSVAADVMDYFMMVGVANIQLCQMIIHTVPEGDSAWDALKLTYRTIWNKAGSPGKKMSEIEHLEILLDAFTLVDNQGVNPLVDFVGQLKTELENLAIAEMLTTPY
jgi:CHAT domain-containing protein/pimeloyl-ACP methyl ester carboxylesterase